jgi:hypothetical protein
MGSDNFLLLFMTTSMKIPSPLLGRKKFLSVKRIISTYIVIWKWSHVILWEMENIIKMELKNLLNSTEL